MTSLVVFAVTKFRFVPQYLLLTARELPAFARLHTLAAGKKMESILVLKNIFPKVLRDITFINFKTITFSFK